jgi:hypothetical protein
MSWPLALKLPVMLPRTPKSRLIDPPVMSSCVTTAAWPGVGRNQSADASRRAVTPRLIVLLDFNCLSGWLHQSLWLWIPRGPLSLRPLLVGGHGVNRIGTRLHIHGAWSSCSLHLDRDHENNGKHTLISQGVSGTRRSQVLRFREALNPLEKGSSNRDGLVDTVADVRRQWQCFGRRRPGILILEDIHVRRRDPEWVHGCDSIRVYRAVKDLADQRRDTGIAGRRVSRVKPFLYPVLPLPAF